MRGAARAQGRLRPLGGGAQAEEPVAGPEVDGSQAVLGGELSAHPNTGPLSVCGIVLAALDIGFDEL
jgi:hypothetical protein